MLTALSGVITITPGSTQAAESHRPADSAVVSSHDMGEFITREESRALSHELTPVSRSTPVTRRGQVSGETGTEDSRTVEAKSAFDEIFLGLV